MRCSGYLVAFAAALTGVYGCASDGSGTKGGTVGQLSPGGPVSGGTAGNGTTMNGFIGGGPQVGTGGAKAPVGTATGGTTGTMTVPPAATGGIGGKGAAGMSVPPATTGGKGGNMSTMGSAGASTLPPTMSAKDPKIPAISGECPVFMTGSVNFGGFMGMQMEVGAKTNGTGPMVFYWHGTGSTSGEYVFATGGLAQSVTSAGGILISPQSGTGTGGDCSGTGTFAMDDFKIADQLVACAVRDHGIDPHRIYTTGCSAGGLQAGCMATVRSSYIAAAAPNSGGATFPLPIQDMTHIPAMMTMHGDDADMVIVYFKDTSNTIDQQFAKAGGYVMDCDHAGGHCGAPADLYMSAWTFMKDHPFGVSPEPYASGIPAGFPKYCMQVK